MKKVSVRIITGILSVALLLTALAVPAVAVNETDATVSVADGTVAPLAEKPSGDDYDYHAYKLEHEGNSPAVQDIVLDGSAYTAESGSGVVSESEYEGQTNVIVWESQKGSVDYTFNIPADALYNISFTYKALDSSERDLDFGIKIDGEYPFFGADALELPRMWMDMGEFREDDYGNQFAAEQETYTGFTKKAVFDISGASVYPMEFFFTAGTHTVTVVTNAEDWVISKIALTVPESVVKPYADVKKEYEAAGYKSADTEPITIEAEHADVKSSRSLIPYADNGSPEVTPSSATRSQVNYIGNTNWKLPNEEIKWFIEVPADGLYKIGFKYKQDQVINGFSYRHLKIDGVTPFSECANIKFNYTIGWKDFVFGDENGEYEFYLTAGKHEFSLMGTLGELSESYYKLKDVTTDVGDLYLDIVMITGETPDPNLSYELFKTIPGFEDRIADYYNRLKELVAEMQALSGEETSSYIASMNNTARVLKSMLDNRYTSHEYVSEYFSEYTQLSSWLYSMQEMALSIDCIKFTPVDKEVEFKHVGFFSKEWFKWQRFFISFSESYSKISVAKEGSKVIRIWVNWGRDQSQVLNNLINESFVPYAEKELGYPVSVNLELVNADIIKGMLSNNAPDLSLHLVRSSPVNLAMRGALVDLRQFEDCDEVLTRFGSTASVPYEYHEGLYALPDQQSFYIMFYRTDIFEELQLEVPNTWEEFLAVTAALQRNNMNAYLETAPLTSVYTTLLMQHGGEVFNEARDELLLDSPISLTSFTYWTDMHTKYKLPVSASFYNRFRAGTIPLGVCTYTQYTTLAEAAPEVAGRWKIALIPGVEKEDGTVDRTICGSGTGCSILNTTKLPLESWTFLKWWTEEATQTRYNTNVESILGTISRITTANLKAFENMTWERGDLEILLEQREWIKEVPEVPGSYYVSRSIDQAFWAVYNDVNAPKDALTRWALEANNEIDRKIKEYS